MFLHTKKVYNFSGKIWWVSLCAITLEFRNKGVRPYPFRYFIRSPNQSIMNVTFEELRRVKHALPTGSIGQLATEFNMDEEAVRNYFGGGHYKNGQLAEFHLESGYGGGVVHLEDTTIFDRAMEMIEQHKVSLQ